MTDAGYATAVDALMANGRQVNSKHDKQIRLLNGVHQTSGRMLEI